jgi:glycosyltransferase involved in cell wall biosynthesis
MTALELLLGTSVATLAPLTLNAMANAWCFRPLPLAVPQAAESVSLLVPARNEAARLEPLLASLLALPDASVRECLVYDDDSDDGTDRLVAAYAARDARIRLIRGGDLPPGWGGKVHALHRLSQEARGAYLLFLDADVTLEAGAVDRALTALHADRLDILSLYPRQVLGTWGERVFVPVMVYYFFLLGSQWALRQGKKPPAVAINGQFMLWRREAYDAIGGYESIKTAWLDDMTIGKRAVDMGLAVSYRPGAGAANCRMYTGFTEVWNGFVKHTWDSFSQPTPVYLALHAWLFVALVLPWLIAAMAPWLPWTPLAAGLLAAIAGMTALTRLLACTLGGGGWVSAACHPVAMAGALANGLVSWRLSRNRTSEWKGRTRAGTASPQPHNG